MTRAALVLALAAIFAGAFALAHVLAARVDLPFSNPREIVGTLTRIRYNPWNSIVRFLLIVGLPTLTLAAVFVAGPARLVSWLFPLARTRAPEDPPHATRRPRLFLPALIVTTLLIALNAKSYMSTGTFETFEEGLSLSAGISYLNGGTPYRDFAFFHGLYDEPLRTAIAFTLFGPSIGSARALQSINKLITFGFLAWFLARLFRRDGVYVFVVLLALHLLEPQGKYLSLNRAGIETLHSVIVMPRDMALFPFLAVMAILADRIRRSDFTDEGVFWLVTGWSALPGLAYIYSLERGVYLVLAFAVFAPLCYVLFFRHGPAAKPFLAGCATGWLLSAGLLTILIGGAFPDLLQLTAFLASDNLQLQFSYPYPYMQRSYIIIDLMIASSCFLVFWTFFTHWRAARGIVEGLRGFLREHLMEATLLMVSLLYFRNALGRADWIHVAYALPAPTILFVFLGARHVLIPLSRKVEAFRIVLVTGCLILVAVHWVMLSRNILRDDLVRENFPLAVDDSYYLPAHWKRTVSFLRDNLSSEESFYTLSDELSLYYFVGRACPVRFPLLDMVVKDEKVQRAIIEDLEARNVKYVVTDPKSPYFQLDGISNELRAPLVFDYVRAHYQRDREIDGWVVLIRKSV